MKKWALCGDGIPNWVTIEGKPRCLQNRKRCLRCSPFGLHNTRRVTPPQEHETVCVGCSRIYVHRKSSGHSRTRCNSCMANAWKTARKQRCLSYKGGICARCGYSKCLRSLIFHHRNPAEKKFGIAGSHCRKWEVVQEELDKCDLLCTNCHGEEHERLEKISACGTIGSASSL